MSYRNIWTESTASVAEIRDKLETLREKLNNKAKESVDAYFYALERSGQAPQDDWNGDILYEDTINDLIAGFDPFLEGSLAACIDALDLLDSGQSSFAAIYDEVRQADDDLSEWNAQAAFSFRVNFLQNFEVARANQDEVYKELIGVVVAYRECLVLMRNGANDIVDHAIEAVDNLGGGAGWGDFFKAIGVAAGIVAAVAAALPTGGASAVAAGSALASAKATLAGGAAITGALASAGGYIVEHNAEGTTTSAPAYSPEAGNAPDAGYDDIWSLIDAIAECVNALGDWVEGEVEAINAGLEEDVDLIDNADHPFQVARPHVADNPDFQDFGSRETIEVYSLFDLWFAGSVRFPKAAVAYAETAIALDSLSISSTVSNTWLFDTVGKFLVVRRRLLNALSGTRNDLVDTGTALVAIAWAYAETDQDNAELVHDSAGDLEEDLRTEIAAVESSGGLNEQPDGVPEAPQEPTYPQRPSGSMPL